MSDLKITDIKLRPAVNIYLFKLKLMVELLELEKMVFGDF